tara:strand:- start:47601 stop:48521 length:921 start_codon:yes stop_codon:yes gene_type:complete
MSVPILLVTGFLGAGKTSFINRLLQAEHGRRIATIVNDFGAINIDAMLIGEADDTVIGLKNGCICCSLQGDLLRTLRQILGRPESFDLIVVEASGVADPAGIVQALLDPVIWQSAALDTIVCVVDAEDAGSRRGDPLWQAQLRQADLVCLSKTETLDAAAAAAVRQMLTAAGKTRIFDAGDPLLPLTAILGQARSSGISCSEPGVISDDRFASLEWEHPGSLPLAGFQSVIGRLSPSLLRVKGFLRLDEQGDRTLVFQMAGQRATLAPAETVQASGCRLVLIGERDRFDPAAARDMLDAVARGDSA